MPRFYYADSEILVSEYIDGFALDADKALPDTKTDSTGYRENSVY